MSANFGKDQFTLKVDKNQVLNIDKMLREISAVMEKPKYKRFRTNLAKAGGKIIQKEIKKRIPKRKFPLGVTGRYSTPKVSGKYKAPKGYGVLSTYQPIGTAKKSVKVFQSRLNRRYNDVTVGPVTKRNNKNPKFDGWYVRFLEQGTKLNQSWQLGGQPIRRAVASGGRTALSTMEKILKDKFNTVQSIYASR